MDAKLASAVYEKAIKDLVSPKSWEAGKELKKTYPDLLNNIPTGLVVVIWSSYSDSRDASWLVHDRAGILEAFKDLINE